MGAAMLDPITTAAIARKVWQVIGIRGAIAIGLALALPIHGCAEHRKGYREGVESVETRLKEAEAESLKKAAVAARKADEAGEQRALVEAETRAADLKAIERAEAENTNALDGLF
jgi:hypothetical protein